MGSRVDLVFTVMLRIIMSTRSGDPKREFDDEDYVFYVKCNIDPGKAYWYALLRMLRCLEGRIDAASST